VATLLPPGVNRRGRSSSANYLPKFTPLRLKLKLRFRENPADPGLSLYSQRMRVIKRLRLGTSSFWKMEWRCFLTMATLNPALSAIS
jgi:hypothetical protein